MHRLYKTIQKSKPPWLVLRDQGSMWITAHQALCEGPQDKWLVERITRDIENIGHSEITLKGDNEPAMQQFMTAVKEKASLGKASLEDQRQGVSSSNAGLAVA